MFQHYALSSYALTCELLIRLLCTRGEGGVETEVAVRDAEDHVETYVARLVEVPWLLGAAPPAFPRGRKREQVDKYCTE